MNKSEITPLIKLLDDPDPGVFQAIKQKLLLFGIDTIPILEEAWETSLNTLFQTRIEDIILEIHQSHIKNRLKEWGTNDNSNDLLKGAIIVSQFQYPNIQEKDIQEKVDRIKKDIWLEINDNLTALEKIKIVNHIFFDIHKYISYDNKHSKNHISNFFPHHVLDTKKGIPITLAIIYASICQQLNLPVYGVDLYKNFILCFRDYKYTNSTKELTNDILFYINPFNKGVVFGGKDIEVYLKEQKLENKPLYFSPLSNKNTIITLINEIITFYDNDSKKTKAEEYRSLLKFLYF